MKLPNPAQTSSSWKRLADFVSALIRTALPTVHRFLQQARWLEYVSLRLEDLEAEMVVVSGGERERDS